MWELLSTKYKEWLILYAEGINSEALRFYISNAAMWDGLRCHFLCNRHGNRVQKWYFARLWLLFATFNACNCCMRRKCYCFFMIILTEVEQRRTSTRLCIYVYFSAKGLILDVKPLQLKHLWLISFFILC